MGCEMRRESSVLAAGWLGVENPAAAHLAQPRDQLTRLLHQRRTVPVPVPEEERRRLPEPVSGDDPTPATRPRYP